MISWRAVGLYSASVIGVHSAFIEYSKNEKAMKISKISNTAMSVGSAEDIILDSIHTGDIILFQRKWYKQHLPMALSIMMYRYLHSSDFDHVGVCIEYDGVPFIWERTPFSGYRLRSLQDRLSRSDAKQIVVLPMNLDNFISPEARQPLLSYCKAQAKSSNMMSNELISYIEGYVSLLRAYLSAVIFSRSDSAHTQNNNPAILPCSQSREVLHTLAHLNISIDEKASLRIKKSILPGAAKLLTLQDFLQPKEVLWRARAEEANKTKDITVLAGEPVVIRSTTY